MTLSLHVKDLRITTGKTRLLLDVPQLAVEAGTKLGIRGPSGAGKSTLLNALSGLLDVEGRVTWGETALSALPAGARAAFRAKHLGLIFQDFLLFEELSSGANAGLAALFSPARDRAATRHTAQDHLDRLGVPQGDRSVASFSGGERQRVAVARALASDPAVLLADEPTAALDRATADRLIADLVALSTQGGKTFIAVSHDTRLLDRMDRVITLDDGRIQPDAKARPVIKGRDA